jgi:GNAT superfamily N-acetyltransferase
MVQLRDLAAGDAGWVLQQHALHYLRSDGFGADFEALVAETLAGFLRRPDPVRERAWIAEAGGQRLGCIFLYADAPQTARLRLFYVTGVARGQGLGRSLLTALMEGAAERGYRRLRVATHASHAEAGHLYAVTGFALVSSSPVTSFGQPLVEQHWEIDLPTTDTLAIAGGRG